MIVDSRLPAPSRTIAPIAAAAPISGPAPAVPPRRGRPDRRAPGADPPPRPGAARLLAVLAATLAAASLPGALRAQRPEEPPWIPVRAARIDVNRAPPDEISALPGVGSSLAARIVAERARGPYRSPADLRRVPGIGEALAARMAPHVVFGPPP